MPFSMASRSCKISVADFNSGCASRYSAVYLGSPVTISILPMHFFVLRGRPKSSLNDVDSYNLNSRFFLTYIGINLVGGLIPNFLNIIFCSFVKGRSIRLLAILDVFSFASVNNNLSTVIVL